MKYETPELTTSTPAINAIQSTNSKCTDCKYPDIFDPVNPLPEQFGAYTDWE
jgi:hypothetical protein